MDPDHIFRILNIFAAHFDSNNVIDNKHEAKPDDKTHENKFDFDKIIISCDLDNIRNIYHNRYGSNVDFNGYINKFFSKGVFQYENIENTKQMVDKIIESITTDSKTNAVIQDNNQYKDLLSKILKDLVNCRKITPRHLFRHSFPEYIIPLCRVKLGRGEVHNWQIPITVVFEFIIDLYGSDQSAIEAIQAINIDLHLESLEFRQRFVGELILMDYIRSIKNNSHSIQQKPHTFRTKNFTEINGVVNCNLHPLSDGNVVTYWGDCNKAGEVSDQHVKEALENAFRRYVVCRDPHAG
jgi:hypothetical protein